MNRRASRNRRSVRQGAPTERVSSIHVTAPPATIAATAGWDLPASIAVVSPAALAALDAGWDLPAVLAATAAPAQIDVEGGWDLPADVALTSSPASVALTAGYDLPAAIALTAAPSTFAATAGYSDPFTPANIGSTYMKLWLDDSVPASLLKLSGAQAAPGDSVHTRKDQSGNGNDAVALVTDALLTASVQNGIACCIYSGSSFMYHKTAAINPGATGQIEVWLVMRNDGGTARQCHICTDQSFDNSFLVAQLASSYGQWSTVKGGTNSKKNVGTAAFSSSTSIYRFTADRNLSGAAQTTLTNAAGTAGPNDSSTTQSGNWGNNNVFIGAGKNTANDAGAQGPIMEVIYLVKSLDAIDATFPAKLIAYWQNKWAI